MGLLIEMPEDKSDEEEFTGLRKVLEKYSYIDDVLNETKGLIIQIDSYKSKIEFFMRKKDITLKKKNELLNILKKYSDEVKKNADDLKKNFKHMTSTDRRLKLQKIVESLREMFKKVDEYV